jgi:hypothetical protein
MTKDELKKWCRDNWNKIDENRRQLCINHLKAKIPAEVIAAWKTSGYDHQGFHLFGGMAVRNILRDIIKDDQLPPVRYETEGSITMAQNWDDYYTGALDQLLEETDATS